MGEDNGGARLPKEPSLLPTGFVSRRYFVHEAEAGAEPRRWMCHHQIIPLIQGFIVRHPIDAIPSVRLGARIGVANRKAANPVCLR